MIVEGALRAIRGLMKDVEEVVVRRGTKNPVKVTLEIHKKVGRQLLLLLLLINMTQSSSGEVRPVQQTRQIPIITRKPR
jgi:hypothetical protein